MDRELWGEIRRLIAPVERKLRLVATKAIVELVKDDIGLQGAQVSLLEDETSDEGAEHMQPGGLTHKPFQGAEGVFLSIGGVRDDGVVICVSDRRYRPKDLEDGETCLYNEGDKQSTLHMKADGSIEVTAKTGGDNPSTLIMAADGSVTVVADNGGSPSSLTMAADGSVTVAADGGGNPSTIAMDASGNVVVESTADVQVNTGGSMVVDSGADVTLGSMGAVKVGGPEAAEAIPLGTTQMTELTKILNYLIALNTAIGSGPLPEAGMGAPSAFQTALIAATSALGGALPASLATTVSQKHKIDE